MKTSASRHTICLVALLLALQLPALAQTGEAPERRVDAQEIRTLREHAENDTSLGDELRAQILKLYDETLGALEEAAADEAKIASARREQTGVGRMVEALRAELSGPEKEPRLKLPENVTVVQAETELARERSRLAVNRSALRDVERLAEERTNARNEISRRLGALDQQIELLSDELRTATQRDTHPELKRATLKSLIARRETAHRKIDALRAELTLLEARGGLIPWQTDQAQRRVTFSEKLVAMLRSATRDLRYQDAARSLQQIREQCAEASEKAVQLTELAHETEELAEMLWGPAGVMIEAEETARSLVATRKNVSDLERIVQLTRRKFEAYGYRGSIVRWWPDIPDDFPRPGDVSSDIQMYESRIPEVQHLLIRLEQQRAKHRTLHDQMRVELGMNPEEGARQEQQLIARGLFNTRRDLLDELVQQHGRHSNQLVELETISRHFLGEVERLQSFLYEQILWLRSVPRPIIPRPVDTGHAFLWLVSWESSRAALRAAWERVAGHPGRALMGLFLFGGTIGLRRWMRRRMAKLAEYVANPDTDSFQLTLEAFLYTALLAAPLPLALYLGSEILIRAADSAFMYSGARALYYTAMVAGLLETIRQLFRPGGLAEAHFGWPPHVLRRVHRGLLWPEIVFLPLIQVAVHFAMAGIRLSSPQELQVYNNSLGRILFIIAMAVLGFSLVSLFRPRRGDRKPVHEGGPGRSQRLYMYAYPAISLATVVPAVLAALGFYVTGVLLAYQMLRTLWLAVGVLILAGLLFRWHTTSRHNLSRQSKEGCGAPPGGAELPEAEAQVRHLFRFVVVLVAGFGLYAIWSDAIPTLKIMDRIQIWPRIALLEERDTGVLVQSGPSSVAGETTSQEEATRSGSGSTAIVPGIPGAPSGGTGDAGDQMTSSSPLTLWQIFQFMLAVMITWTLVRNIPGLLELTLRRRTLIDSGARIALGTLVRYAIMILGMTVAFGLLGISWSKIQWLAAALTFGLAFGLQEIVANFISGLILLMERPVRVGDAVTIGNLQGRVTRIRIRATTITLWDRSEMIVPNKEFITGKLINWTLSDSKRRIDIPLRVAYGADLQKVKDTLLGVARAHPDVLDDPASMALLLDFGDDAIKFELRFFVDFGQGLKTKDDLQMGIDRAFREQGIEFALPRLDIQLPKGAGGPAAEPAPSGPTD